MSRFRLFGVLIEADQYGAWESVTATAWGSTLANAYLGICLRLSMLIAGKDCRLWLERE